MSANVDRLKNPATTEGVLLRAIQLVTGDRAETHGDKRENMDNIAALWTGYLEMAITGTDVALLMALAKVARTRAGKHNADDYIDLCGYGAIAGELAHEDERIVKEWSGERDASDHVAMKAGAAQDVGAAPLTFGYYPFDWQNYYQRYEARKH